MKNFKKYGEFLAKGTAAGLLFGLGALIAAGATWSAPSSGPTANNASAPISATGDQTKAGALILNAVKSDGTYAATGLDVINGNVGIGIASPGAKVQIANGDSSFALFGPNASWGSYLTVGAGGSAVAANHAQVISSNGNLHLDAGVGQFVYIGYFSPGATYINSNGGNVGIGVISAPAKLTVGGFNDGDSLNVVSPVNDSVGIQSALNGLAYNDGTNIGAPSYIAANRLLLQPYAGRVGINVNYPNGQLDVGMATGAGTGDGIVIGQADGNDTETIQTYINSQFGNWAYGVDANYPLYLQPHKGNVIIGSGAGSSLSITGACLNGACITAWPAAGAAASRLTWSDASARISIDGGGNNARVLGADGVTAANIRQVSGTYTEGGSAAVTDYTVSCPGGFMVTGGGVKSVASTGKPYYYSGVNTGNNSAPVYFTNSYPSSASSWSCSGAAGVTFTCYAICVYAPS